MKLFHRLKLLILLAPLPIFLGAATTPQEKPKLQINTSHSNGITAIQYSRDGKIFATGSSDFSIKIWRHADKKLLLTLKGHKGVISDIDFNAEATLLASVAKDGALFLWRITDGKALWSRSVGISNNVRFGVNNDIITSGECLEARRVSDGERLQCLYGMNMRTWSPGMARFDTSPKGDLLVVHVMERFLAFQLSGYKLLWEHDIKGRAGLLLKLAISPDGNTLGSGHVHSFKLWDLKKAASNTGEMVPAWSYDNPAFFRFAFSDFAGKKHLALINSGGEMIQIDYEKLSDVKTVSSHKSYQFAISEMAFQKGGPGLALAGLDIRFWDWERAIFQKEIIYGRLGGFNGSAMFWPDGKKFITTDYRTLSIHEMDNKNDVYNLGLDIIKDTDIHPFGRHMAIVTNLNDVYVWTASNNSMTALKPWPDPNCAKVSEVTFAAKGGLLAYYCAAEAGKKGEIILWVKIKQATYQYNWGNIGALELPNPDTSPNKNQFKLAFNHDGSLLAAADQNSITIWRVGETLDQYQKTVHSIKNNKYLFQFSPTENVLFWYNGRSIEAKRFDEATGEFSGGYSVEVSKDGNIYGALAFAPGGKSFAFGGADGIIRFWRAADGERLDGELVGHSGFIRSISYHKDGLMLLTHAADGATRFWDLQSHKEILGLVSEEGYKRLYFTPDGRFDYNRAEALAMISYRLNETLIDLPDIHDHFYTPGLFERALSGALEEFDGDYLMKSLIHMPSVAILNRDELQQKFSASKKNTMVKFRAQAGGGEIERIEVRVSGALIRAISADEEDQMVGEHIVMIPLAAGETRIDITAYGLYGAPGKETAYVFKELPVGGLEKPSLYALTVGIEKYEDATAPLAYSVDDAQAMEGALMDGAVGLYGYREVRGLANEEASAGNIKGAIEEIQGKAGPDDVVVIYFSGHGYTVSDPQSGEKLYFYRPYDLPGSQTESFQVVKRVAITAEYLNESFAKIKARKVILILDTCHSGGVMTAMDRAASESDHIQMQKFANASGRYIFTSAAGSEIARESPDLGHGLFTWVLLNALQGHPEFGDAAALVDDDNFISLVELRRYLDDYFMEQTAEYRGNFVQNPVVNALGRDPGGAAYFDFDLLQSAP